MSQYGATFDRLYAAWATLENEHDKKHQDRDQCGGVGGCSFMFTAVQLQDEMISALTELRKMEAQCTKR